METDHVETKILNVTEIEDDQLEITTEMRYINPVAGGSIYLGLNVYK
jgi:hypothetical protein